MTIEDRQHEEWREALRKHQREMERLRGEIALLERGDCDVSPEYARVQIQFAHVQLTRHHIDVALIAARLRVTAD